MPLHQNSQFVPAMEQVLDIYKRPFSAEYRWFVWMSLLNS